MVFNIIDAIKVVQVYCSMHNECFTFVFTIISTNLMANLSNFCFFQINTWTREGTPFISYLIILPPKKQRKRNKLPCKTILQINYTIHYKQNQLARKPKCANVFRIFGLTTIAFCSIILVIKEMGFHRVGIIPDRTCSFLFLFLTHHTNTFFLKMHV